MGVDAERHRHTWEYARVAELVDARDLKSLDQKSCGFDSRLAHHSLFMKQQKKHNTPKHCGSAFLDWLTEKWYLARYRNVRFLQRRPHRSFRRTRRRDYRRSLRLPGYIAFTHYVNRVLWKNKGLFLSMIILYALIIIFLGIITSQSTYDSIGKLVSESLGKIFDGGVGQLLNAGMLTFSSLAIDTTSLRAEQGVMLALLVLMTWLTAVWLLREILLGLKPKLRDGLYNATAPLISTSVVLLILLIIASWYYGAGVFGVGIGAYINRRFRYDVIRSAGGKCINTCTLLGDQYDYCASRGGFAWYVSAAGNPGCQRLGGWPATKDYAQDSLGVCL